MLCSPISIGICMIVLMRQQLHVEHKTISHIKFYRYWQLLQRELRSQTKSADIKLDAVKQNTAENLVNT